MGENQNVSLSMDPRYDGTRTCKTSAEDWLRAMETKAKVARFTDTQSVDYAMRHLEGSAAEFFDTVLKLTQNALHIAVKTDWTLWQQTFRKEFFKEGNTADAAIDWNTIKQEHGESAVTFYHRVAASISHFISRTCGTVLGDDTRSPKLFTLLTEDTQLTMTDKARWTTAIADGLVTAQSKDTRVHRVAEPEAATAAYLEFTKDTQAMVTEVIDTMKARFYRATTVRLATALTLKSLHSGLRHAKCRDLVFKAMMDENFDMSELSRMLRSTEQDIENQRMNGAYKDKRNHNKFRKGIAAYDDGNSDDDGANDDDEGDYGSDTDNEQVSAARNDGGKRTGTRGVCFNCGGKGHFSRDCNKACGNCSGKGHISRDCKKPKKATKAKAKGEQSKKSEN